MLLVVGLTGGEGGVLTMTRYRVGAVVAVLGGYYIAHLETVPHTGILLLGTNKTGVQREKKVY